MYPYISENNLYEKQSYMYSDYLGMAFLKDYLASRKEFLHQFVFLEESEELAPVERAQGETPVCRELQALRRKLEAGGFDRESKALMDQYTKGFEVRKRLYSDYEADWKPKADAGFQDYDSYLLFADTLLLQYAHTKGLKYLNCLLKLDDTLLSIQKQLSDQQRGHLSRILNQELTCFYQLAENIGIDLENTK